MSIGKRIDLLVKTLNLTGIKFAESIGVNSSNITHIVGDRSKPSYSFLLSILETYPEVSSDWLMIGAGEMFKSEINLQNIIEEPMLNEHRISNTIINEYDIQKDELISQKITTNDVIKTVFSLNENNPLDAALNPTQTTPIIESSSSKVKSILKIIIMYTDNTFEEIIK